MAQVRGSHTQFYLRRLVFMNGTEGTVVDQGHGGTQTLESEETIDFGLFYTKECKRKYSDLQLWHL